MADNNIKQNQGTTDRNQTMQHEQAKASAGGDNTDRNPTGEFDKNRQEKSAIGGQASSPTSQTGEQGRGRDELGKDRKTETTGQNR